MIVYFLHLGRQRTLALELQLSVQGMRTVNTARSRQAGDVPHTAYTDHHFLCSVTFVRGWLPARPAYLKYLPTILKRLESAYILQINKNKTGQSSFLFRRRTNSLSPALLTHVNIVCLFVFPAYFQAGTYSTYTHYMDRKLKS